MKGRKPQSNVLKIANGTRKSRLNPREAQAVPGDPVCPRHLDGIARAEWRKMVALLSELGVLSKTDGSALAIYCSAHSQWRRAEEQMRAKGMIIDTARGGR